MTLKWNEVLLTLEVFNGRIRLLWESYRWVGFLHHSIWGELDVPGGIETNPTKQKYNPKYFLWLAFRSWFDNTFMEIMSYYVDDSVEMLIVAIAFCREHPPFKLFHRSFCYHMYNRGTKTNQRNTSIYLEKLSKSCMAFVNLSSLSSWEIQWEALIMWNHPRGEETRGIPLDNITRSYIDTPYKPGTYTTRPLSDSIPKAYVHIKFYKLYFVSIKFITIYWGGGGLRYS